jgi:hypothetical protein
VSLVAGALALLVVLPAAAMAARPVYSAPERTFCVNVCVHWVETTRDAPPLRDADGNRVPDWVDTTVGVMEHIWQKEVVEFGFNPPKSDLALVDHGPDARLDIYLKDIADEVLGYCVPEVPRGYQFYDVPGYCVLDDDYSLAQLGPPTAGGRRELELTAAHEFFHAIQFGYDFADDGWLLEGTATWMEDAVYDSENEPYGRFPYSPLLHPEVPVDTFSGSQPFQYGSWVFWRFLEEYFAPTRGQPAPGVIRRVWELAAGGPGQADLYSLEAVQAVAHEHGSSLRTAFAAFGAVNAVPRSFYREGAGWPSSPAARSFVLTSRRRETQEQRLVLNHLTNRHVELRPGAGVGRAARLALTLDLPSSARGAEATAVVVARSGAARLQAIRLDAAGNGTVRVPFGRGSVQRVVLVLTNASARYTCGVRTALACGGQPLDDNQTYRFRARLLP